MNRSKIPVIPIILLVMGLMLGSCGKPVKTVAYFHEHVEEIQVEARRCVEDARNKIDISKDQTCMNVVEVEKIMCRQKLGMMGNPFGVDCDDKVAMMAIAWHGL